MEDSTEITIDDRIYYPDGGVIEEKFQTSDGEDIVLRQNDGGYISYDPGELVSGKYIVEVLERKTGACIGRCKFTVMAGIVY